MAWRHPFHLDDYLWLLMLNEHFIDYQSIVTTQIEAQLKSSQFQQLHPGESLGIAQPTALVQTGELTPAQ